MSRVGVVACGALAVNVRRVARRRGWDVEVHPVPALLHNRPERIAPAVASTLDSLRARHDVLAVAYGDCGTRGALDDALSAAGVERLGGDDCYAIYGGDLAARAVEEEPGTYFLTDFLARTFFRTVWQELGLDRYPELRDDYFGNYRRVVWLSQRPDPELAAAAATAAERLGLPLERVHVGDEGLERELRLLLDA
ncbi:MAG: hypothetical protein QOJ12_1650 [Thermoleophilales bacterium]|nr:hypothetical protein [Thermoleophilales bacterium]